MQSSDILFTMQHHDADRAGPHNDIRLVIGNVAHSFATRKEPPPPGKAITLYETSLHTKDYALRKHIVIPKGSYGAGTTKLQFVRKAKLIENKEKGHFVMETSNGERYLLKPLPLGKDGKNKPWLFKNLGPNKVPDNVKPAKPELEKKANLYLEKIATTIRLYEHRDGGRKWVVEGNPAPEGDWTKTKITKHITRKSK